MNSRTVARFIFVFISLTGALWSFYALHIKNWGKESSTSYNFHKWCEANQGLAVGWGILIGFVLAVAFGDDTKKSVWWYLYILFVGYALGHVHWGPVK